MKSRGSQVSVSVVVISLLTMTAASEGVRAQQASPAQLQEVIVTGSRIAQTEAQREQPLSVIST